jgi:hypothetical protein
MLSPLDLNKVFIHYNNQDQDYLILLHDHVANY